MERWGEWFMISWHPLFPFLKRSYTFPGLGTCCEKCWLRGEQTVMGWRNPHSRRMCGTPQTVLTKSDRPFLLRLILDSLQTGIAARIGTECHCAPSRIRFLCLPAAFGHKRLTEDFANLQKVLIAESACYNRYSDRHLMCSGECRNVGDRHMNSLYEVS